MLGEMSRLHDHLGYTELLTNSRNILVRGIFKGIEIKVACNKYIINIAIRKLFAKWKVYFIVFNLFHCSILASLGS